MNLDLAALAADRDRSGGQPDAPLLPVRELLVRAGLPDAGDSLLCLAPYLPFTHRHPGVLLQRDGQGWLASGTLPAALGTRSAVTAAGWATTGDGRPALFAVRLSAVDVEPVDGSAGGSHVVRRVSMGAVRLPGERVVALAPDAMAAVFAETCLLSAFGLLSAAARCLDLALSAAGEGTGQGARFALAGCAMDVYGTRTLGYRTVGRRGGAFVREALATWLRAADVAEQAVRCSAQVVVAAAGGWCAELRVLGERIRLLGAHPLTPHQARGVLGAQVHGGWSP